jgi:hypothetical protein
VIRVMCEFKEFQGHVNHVMFTVVEASGSDGLDAETSCCVFFGGKLSEYVLCKL